jgi:Domain of unknown function (DUF4920)
MKYLLAAAAITLGAASCSNDTGKTGNTDSLQAKAVQYFGDSISEDGAVPADQVLTLLAGKDSVACKLIAPIEEVCQKKGCWMELNAGAEHTIRVKFLDYAFFVPKDASGSTAIVDGYAYMDTISVTELKHLAEDAGDPKEEIDKITEPEVELTFEARGVIIKKK